MDKKHSIILLLFIILYCLNGNAQSYSLTDLLNMSSSTLDFNIIETEKEINEYDKRLFKLQILPKIRMTATLPNITNSISSITLGDGSEKYVNRSYMTSALSLNLSQLVPFTGGTISLSSSLNRLDNFAPQRNKSYNLNLFNLSYSQNLSIFNQYKWDKKILSKQNELFDISQIQHREKIYMSIVDLFFNLLLAQKKEELNQLMENNATVVYNKAKALYSLGRIPQSELLNAEITMNKYKYSSVHVEKLRCQKVLAAKTNLVSGNPLVTFDFEFFDSCSLTYQIEELIERTIKYGEGIQRELEELTEERDLRKMKASGLPSVSLSFGGGYNSQDEELRQLVDAPSRNFSAVVSIGIPVLSWGENRNRINRLKAENKISELKYKDVINNLMASTRYELECLPLLIESIIASKKTICVLYLQLQDLTEQYDYGRVSSLKINDVQKEIIHEEISRIEYAKQVFSIKYKYRMIALFDVFEGRSINVDYNKK